MVSDGQAFFELFNLVDLEVYNMGEILKVKVKQKMVVQKTQLIKIWPLQIFLSCLEDKRQGVCTWSRMVSVGQAFLKLFNLVKLSDFETGKMMILEGESKNVVWKNLSCRKLGGHVSNSHVF